MKIAVSVTEVSERFFRVSCPSLPGCIAYGRSEEEAVQRMEVAVSGYLASLDAPAIAGADSDSLLALAGAAQPATQRNRP